MVWSALNALVLVTFTIRAEQRTASILSSTLQSIVTLGILSLAAFLVFASSIVHATFVAFPAYTVTLALTEVVLPLAGTFISSLFVSVKEDVDKKNN